MAFFRETYYERHRAAEMKEEARMEAARAGRAAAMDKFLDVHGRMAAGRSDLEAQIAEKAAKAEAAKAVADEEAKAQRTLLETVATMERSAEAHRRAAAVAAREVQAAQAASRHLRDTWDLSDPERLRKATPVRVGEDDPRLGPSSAQIFAGEDPLAAERRKIMIAQRKAWAEQQAAEKAAREAAAHAEEREAAVALARAAVAAEGIAAATAAEMRLRREEAAAANLLAAAERAAAREEERRYEMAAGAATLKTLVTPGAGMGLLAERLEDGVAARDPRRIRPDHYRGLPVAAKEEMTATRVAQMSDRAAREAAERGAAAEDAAVIQQRLRAAAIAERRAAEERRAAAVALRETHGAQREEAAGRKAEERDYLRSVRAGDEFFRSFGRSLN